MKKKLAFTLLETIIVISVFCVGILTVLYGISQTLRNQDYAKTQIQSAFFAREWIEMVFNLRDANYHKELPWNCVFEWSSNLTEDWCKEKLEPWKVLKLDIWNNDKYINIEVSEDSIWDLKEDEEFDKIFEKFQIYKHVDDNTFVYNHIKEWWEETWFARYLVIKSVEWVSSNNSDDNLLKIESHVLYKKWIFKWEKVVETFIWNYEFNQ